MQDLNNKLLKLDTHMLRCFRSYSIMRFLICIIMYGWDPIRLYFVMVIDMCILCAFLLQAIEIHGEKNAAFIH